MTQSTKTQHKLDKVISQFLVQPSFKNSPGNQGYFIFILLKIYPLLELATCIAIAWYLP